MQSKIVVGLGYGDEGKGGIVDMLVRKYQSPLVVRFSGGPQCSHHVVLPATEVSHGFAQFGAGTFAGARTHLSRFMLVEPYAMQNEAEALKRKGIKDPWSILSLDAEAVVITPWHWRMNRLREEHRTVSGRHGSCGMGVGEARADELANEDMVRVKDLKFCLSTLRKIRDRKLSEAAKEFGTNGAAALLELKPETVQNDYRWLRATMHIVSAMPKVDGPVIFEGAQGVLLDETHGFAPYNTWTDTTPNHARTLCAEAGITDIETIGVAPAVFVRHGAGPFVTEFPEPRPILESHNVYNKWQGHTRHGYCDAVALRYAQRHAKVDTIALTRVDQANPFLDVCTDYAIGGCRVIGDIRDGTTAEELTRYWPKIKQIDTFEELGKILGVPISLYSNGPTHYDKHMIAAGVMA